MRATLMDLQLRARVFITVSVATDMRSPVDDAGFVPERRGAFGDGEAVKTGANDEKIRRLDGLADCFGLRVRHYPARAGEASGSLRRTRPISLRWRSEKAAGKTRSIARRGIAMRFGRRHEYVTKTLLRATENSPIHALRIRHIATNAQRTIPLRRCPRSSWPRQQRSALGDLTTR